MAAAAIEVVVVVIVVVVVVAFIVVVHRVPEKKPATLIFDITCSSNSNSSSISNLLAGCYPLPQLRSTGIMTFHQPSE